MKGENGQLLLSTPRMLIGGVEAQLHSLLTSSLDVVQLSDLRSGRFTPVERGPVPTEYEDGWAPQPAWIKERNLLPLQGCEVIGRLLIPY